MRVVWGLYRRPPTLYLALTAFRTSGQEAPEPDVAPESLSQKNTEDLARRPFSRQGFKILPIMVLLGYLAEGKETVRLWNHVLKFLPYWALWHKLHVHDE